jgi:hypothetical protein
MQEGADMAKVVLTHAILDRDRWLQGKQERADTIGAGGGSNVQDYVAQDGSNNVAIAVDVDDVGAIEAMAKSPPPEVVATMESHGVIQPITVYVEA